MRYLREIRAVGFKDWFWFVVLLKRNEFHPHLNGFSRSYAGYLKSVALRDRAHRIDMALMELKEGSNG